MFLPTNAFEAPFAPPRELSYDELHALWVGAGAAYGIPWQVLAAINKIESNFGRNMGPSSAGAVGWMQFMPDTWLRWGTDANGDGTADPWAPEDAVYAAARYLAAAGGLIDVPRAIFAYNHAQWYVDDVLQLAELFGGGMGTDAVFTLDRLGIQLEEARTHLSELNEMLLAAQAVEQELAVVAEAANARSADPALPLSDKLGAEKDAFHANDALAGAVAESARLQAEVGAAEAELEAIRSGAYATSFAPAAAAMLGGPSRADGYVFPVGGGPSVVTVSHLHHDYPAADIAAPLGTPVYALANAVVTDLADDGRCGIGFVLRTAEGLSWVYCHLSHRDSAVQPGAVLSAGQWVGLVGSTGNSTGPHLHLGLQPARYPQEMPWFQEFAGEAFVWQDAPTPLDSRTGDVFAVVPSDAEPAEDIVEFTLAGG